MKKQLWVNKFEVVGIVPGKIVFLGEVLDLSDQRLAIEKVQLLYDSGCRYIKLKNARDPAVDLGPDPIDADASYPKDVKSIMNKLDHLKDKKAKKQKPPRSVS